MALDLTTLSIIAVAVIWIMANVNKQGGVKIVSWRIRGKRGFLVTMIEPDKKVTRKPLPMSRVHNSTPRFSLDDGDYFTGGPDETAYAFGMPNWVYQRGISLPLKLQFPTEITAFASASKIHSAFEDDSIERFNGLKQKQPRINMKLLTYLMVFTLILSMAGAIYSYYYGVNINCAIHTRACP